MTSGLWTLDPGPPAFLFAGGGSGGHLFPGVAVAEELTRRSPGCRIVFAGSGREIESTLLSGTGFRHVRLPVLPPGAAVRQPVAFGLAMWRSVRTAAALLDELRPAAVVGLGGFASVPVALAARRRGTPLILLEQNVVPGRATSWLARRAERVCVSFAETLPHLPRGSRAIVTGNPLRAAIDRAGRRKNGPPTLLVLGGSQGAAGVNRMAVAATTTLGPRLSGWRIVHQAGERDAAAVRAAYAAAGIDAETAAFFPDLPARYASATLAVSRAGATTLAELARLGVPAVLVPYPRSVRDHQFANARLYAAAGAADIMPEGPDDAARLVDALNSMLDTPGRLAAMSDAMRRLDRPDAAAAVADLLAGPTRRARAA